MPSLISECGTKGDSGPMSTLVWQNKDGKIEEEQNARPRVGCAIRVGSVTARSYATQDWWQTSLITEILEDTEEKVVFRTMNSVYTWTP